MKVVRLSIVAWLTACCLAAAGRAEDDKAESKTPPQSEASPAQSQQALFKKFEETMSGAKLVGHFTILGRDNSKMPKEEYTITRVQKLPDGDYWLFNARVKYGNKDTTVPMPLEVKWAGDTPIITLTNLTIPGLGTFSSRVVIYNGKYAGTWTHGEVGGHLFGEIRRADAANEEPADESDS